MRKKVIGILAAAIAAILLAVLFIWEMADHRQDEEIVIDTLRVCHMRNPLGIDEETPVFSWRMESERQGAAQQAYRLCVADSKEGMKKGTYVWDSGRVEEAGSIGIVYQGESLVPRQRYFWQVEVWDEVGKKHSAAEDAWFETGLMGQGMDGSQDKARWISADKEVYRESLRNGNFTYGYGTEPALQAALSYRISYQMEVEGTEAGFAFGAEEGRYGSMYLCGIRQREEEAAFFLKRMENGALGEEEEILDISDCQAAGSSLFAIELEVDRQQMRVTVNGKPAGEFAIGLTPVASIGYYKSRSGTYAYLDNLLVQDENGQIIYQEDFEEADTIFSPYYVAIEDGRLKIGSGMVLTGMKELPAPLFRREFTALDQEITSARLYMTALGSFAASLNGQPAHEDYFAPGKLAFNQQLAYETMDVTDLIKKGEENVLGVILLHGWYDRAVGYPEIWSPWGDTNALMGKLEICYEDGTVQEIVTDEEFSYSWDSPVRYDDIYQGEFYDAAREQVGFDEPGFEDGSTGGENESGVGTGVWHPALTGMVDARYDVLPLTAKKNEPITCVQTISPILVSEPADGVFVYDFGQNFTGTVRVHLKGQAGQIVTLRYGETVNTEEMLNRDDAVGTIWTENLLTAEATDYYVLKGDPEGEIFEPKFTFHGFRFVQITGVEEALPVSGVEGLVLSSDLAQTGEFQCSDENLNRYYQATVWSQKSNFMDNPMDCPQRDERHGWAGDAQIFSLTASYHADSYLFYEKFLEDMAAIQNDGGSFPDMAPRNFGADWDGKNGAASHNCWGDAPVVIAWNLYTQYGEKRIIEKNYDALCRWVDMLESTSEDYVRNWGGYGDHLSMEETPAELSDTAWCAHSADLLSRMAQVLGKEEDAARYRQVYEKFKQAWQEHFVTEDGMTVCNTQTSYALGLCFGLFPEGLTEAAAANFGMLAVYSNYHINTGYSGIGYLLAAYSDNGMTEEAYQMLLQEEYPSLMYLIDQGATTTWENLKGYVRQENGYFLDGSLNHYAYGAPAAWLYTDVLGIKSDADHPGYRHFYLEPKPGGNLDFAEGSYFSPYGEIAVRWEKTEGGYRYFVRIPANTTATLILQGHSQELTSGAYEFIME